MNATDLTMKHLSEILGYPMIVPEAPATTRHRCGIYKPGCQYQPPKGFSAPKHSTSTVDHTGMTATQRKILAVLQKAKEPLDAVKVAKAIKQGQGSASMNMAKMYKMGKLDRQLIQNGQTRWYVYVSKP